MKNLDLIQAGMHQAWFNVQNLDKEDRKKLINRIIKVSSQKGGFIDYYGKYFVCMIIHASEPYYNGKGYQTRVPEFDKAGWYDDKNELIFNKIMGK